MCCQESLWGGRLWLRGWKDLGGLCPEGSRPRGPSGCVCQEVLFDEDGSFSARGGVNVF